uniref:ATP synthase F0 subunit 8 n=1 Tax=Ulnaria acus TaxID=1436140 RepID=D2JP77_9STRA|nr:ATP synthase F0 subunit 8 [Ulnaria acus]ACX62006.1 ATP synthase F0 subunit 8 [Ulnaria acus]
MPQFDILTINSQSSTLLSLVCLFYSINILYFILPCNITEKYRNKVVIKTNKNISVFNEICSNYTWLIRYYYNCSLKKSSN